MPATTRLALPYPTASDTADVPRDVQALADKLDPASGAGAAMDSQGTLAARPAAAVRGRYYFATDNRVLYRDDGAAWSAVTPPTVGGRVNANGTIAAGVGFTIAKGGTGVYTATLPASFVLTGLSVTPFSSAFRVVVTQSITATAFNVVMGTIGAVAVDEAWSFIAIGTQ